MQIQKLPEDTFSLVRLLNIQAGRYKSHFFFKACTETHIMFMVIKNVGLKINRGWKIWH